MHRLQTDPAAISDILIGAKTIEVRLGKPEIIKIRLGDKLTFSAQPGPQAAEPLEAEVTQLLYFESAQELLQAVGWQESLPHVQSVDEAFDFYENSLSSLEQKEYGVVAIRFEL